MNGQDDAVRALLEARCNINLQGKDDDTALHLDARNGAC